MVDEELAILKPARTIDYGYFSVNRLKSWGENEREKLSMIRRYLCL